MQAIISSKYVINASLTPSTTLQKVISAPLVGILQRGGRSPRPPCTVVNLTELYWLPLFSRPVHSIFLLPAMAHFTCSILCPGCELAVFLPATEMCYFLHCTLAEHLKPLVVCDTAPEAGINTEPLRPRTYLTWNYPSIVLHI